MRVKNVTPTKGQRWGEQDVCCKDQEYFEKKISMMPPLV